MSGSHTACRDCWRSVEPDLMVVFLLPMCRATLDKTLLLRTSSNLIFVLISTHWFGSSSSGEELYPPPEEVFSGSSLKALL